MASSVSYSRATNDVDHAFRERAALEQQAPVIDASRAAGISAVCIEFVVKPHETQRAATEVPHAIARALKYVTGFAGCLVMILDQEARLVTVVTFWKGEDRLRRCSQNAGCVQALLAPYLDRRLRVQTMVAHLHTLGMIRPEAVDVSGCSTMPDGLSEEETVCVG